MACTLFSPPPSHFGWTVSYFCFPKRLFAKIEKKRYGDLAAKLPSSSEKRELTWHWCVRKWSWKKVDLWGEIPCCNFVDAMLLHRPFRKTEYDASLPFPHVFWKVVWTDSHCVPLDKLPRFILSPSPQKIGKKKKTSVFLFQLSYHIKCKILLKKSLKFLNLKLYYFLYFLLLDIHCLQTPTVETFTAFLRLPGGGFTAKPVLEEATEAMDTQATCLITETNVDGEEMLLLLLLLLLLLTLSLLLLLLLLGGNLFFTKGVFWSNRKLRTKMDPEENWTGSKMFCWESSSNSDCSFFSAPH